MATAAIPTKTVPKRTTTTRKKAVSQAAVKPKKVAKRISVPSVKAFEVKTFCQLYKIIRPNTTRLTGYSLRAVNKWATGENSAAPARKQLAELVRLFDALPDLMESKNVGPWLKAPNPAFANSSPMQVIERGETDRIWRMIYQLETGEPA